MSETFRCPRWLAAACSSNYTADLPGKLAESLNFTQSTSALTERKGRSCRCVKKYLASVNFEPPPLCTKLPVSMFCPGKGQCGDHAGQGDSRHSAENAPNIVACHLKTEWKPECLGAAANLMGEHELSWTLAELSWDEISSACTSEGLTTDTGFTRRARLLCATPAYVASRGLKKGVPKHMRLEPLAIKWWTKMSLFASFEVKYTALNKQLAQFIRWYIQTRGLRSQEHTKIRDNNIQRENNLASRSWSSSFQRWSKYFEGWEKDVPDKKATATSNTVAPIQGWVWAFTSCTILNRKQRRLWHWGEVQGKTHRILSL